MLKKLLLIIFVIVSIQLSGCATNAAPERMTASPPVNQKLQNKSLANNITLRTVSGGHETNPLLTSQVDDEGFKQAIIASLKNSRLYGGDAKYALDVNLLKLKQPFLGFDLTVTCQAHYLLQDETSNQIIFDKDLTTSYTATVSDAFVAIERLKMANEGAVRANIAEFIKQLYEQPARLNKRR
jgi:hypothetical protein